MIAKICHGEQVQAWLEGLEITKRQVAMAEAIQAIYSDCGCPQGMANLCYQFLLDHSQKLLASHVLGPFSSPSKCLGTRLGTDKTVALVPSSSVISLHTVQF